MRDPIFAKESNGDIKGFDRDLTKIVYTKLRKALIQNQDFRSEIERKMTSKYFQGQQYSRSINHRILRRLLYAIQILGIQWILQTKGMRRSIECKKGVETTMSFITLTITVLNSPNLLGVLLVLITFVKDPMTTCGQIRR